MSELLKTVEVKTAEEFLSEIVPTGSNFSRLYEPREWIFRGQGQDLPLLPKAHRPSVYLLDWQGKWKRDSYPTEAQQIELEAATLYHFFWSAEANGLRIPEDSQQIRAFLRDMRNSVNGDRAKIHKNWPEPCLLSAIALGQHYGLPTRLLDWTYAPLIAAYFAAAAAVEGYVPETGNLVVWAFRARQLQVIPLWPDQDGSDYRIEFVTAPPSDNENLRAQKGLFTLVRVRVVDPWEANANFGAEPFEETIERRITSKAVAGPILLRFLLPASESRKLLWLLAKNQITAASVYPGFAGVVSSLQERSHWPERDD